MDDERVLAIIEMLKTILGVGDYPKLVRHEIPKVIRQKGEFCPPTKRLKHGSADAKYYALKKVLEELVEFCEAKTKKERHMEGGDLMLSSCTFLREMGVNMDLMVEMQTAKEDEKGGFEKLILLLEKP